MKALIYFLFFLFLLTSTSTATIRYVSKTGTSTEPYTSWTTAADSIQKCIDFSQSGDTIYIGPGTFIETLVVSEGIALIGSGIDSTVIDSHPIAHYDIWTIDLEEGNLLKNLQVRSDNNENGIAVRFGYSNNYSIIENCFFRDAVVGINLSNTNGIARNNLIRNCFIGIRITANSDGYIPKALNNVILMDNVSPSGTGIKHSLGAGRPIINNNIIISNLSSNWGIDLIRNATEIKNNLVVHKGNGRSGFYFSIGEYPVENNLVVGKTSLYAIKFFNGTHHARNNMVLNGSNGIRMDEEHAIDFKYNNVWNTTQPYINFTPDSTNLAVDPMVVSEDSLDFHLQKFSPLIDSGDPNILDVDGSRSDIGLYGGPNGEVYFYQDRAPKVPVNLNGVIDSNIVAINWNRNHEADFSHYRIYRDNSSGFDISPNNLIAEKADTFFNDQISSGRNLYYKLTSVDSTGNESQPSEELEIIVVGVEEAEAKPVEYLLYQNYPNPFNPTTTIGYRIKEAGFVRLTVYDIKGEKVAQLENDYKEAGYHEVQFTGKKNEGNSAVEIISSGLYIYWLEVRNENNVPVFIDSGKMMMVK